MSLDPVRLKKEWEELFDPLPNGFEFIGVQYDPPWMAGGVSGCPAGDTWEWFIVDRNEPPGQPTFDMAYYEAMRPVWEAVERPISETGSRLGTGDQYHWVCKHEPERPSYPSGRFEQWPSRQANSFLDQLEAAVRTDLDRVRRILNGITHDRMIR